MHKALRYGFIAIVAMLAMACNKSPRAVDVHDQARSVWTAAEEFRYTNTDSLKHRDIAIVVRYDSGYEADSIALRVMTIAPDSMLLEEPFTLRVPRLGDMRPEEQRFVYRSNVVLKHKGDYLFRITPEQPVEGIASVGITIDE